MIEENDIHGDTARRFVGALRQFERDHDLDALAELFTADATLARLDGHEHRDVRDFWSQYRDQFDQIQTTFTNAVESDDETALEWISDASLPDGRPLSYPGVTVLALEGPLIRTLRTYYDSAAFIAPPARTD